MFNLVKAARYLGVAPWELAKQAPLWMDWACLAQEVDAYVAEETARRSAPIGS